MPTFTKLVSIIAVLVAGICTSAFNWHFSYALGRTEREALTWAIFSVALDLTKWTMLIVAARAWPSMQAVAAFLIWSTATLYSFTAAIGFASTNQAHREQQARIVREHRDAVMSAKRSPLWSSTHACTQVSTRAARDYCQAVRLLEVRQSAPPVPAHTDSFVTLFNIEEATARLLLSVYLALACEVISALGLFAVSAHPNPHNRRVSCSSSIPTWLRRRRPATTAASSSSDAISTPVSPNSASKRSPTSSAGSWQRPKSWRSM